MAVEVEVIKYEGDIKDLQKQQRAAEQGFTSLEKKAKTTTDNVKGSFNGLGSSIKNALSSLPIGGVVSDLDNAAQSARNVSTGLSGIGSSAKNATGGVFSLGNALKVGVLGVLALIIVAVSSVVAFIKQTDEGGAKLEATFAGLGAVTDVFTGKLVTLGGAITGAFSKEGGAVSGIKEFTSNLTNMLIEGAKVVTGYKALQIAGIENTNTFKVLAKAVALLKAEFGDAYDEAYALSLALDAIQDNMRVLGVETRQTELQIAALLKQTRNRGLDIGERLNIVSQAFALENQNLEKNFNLQRQYYENIAKTNLLKLQAINSDKQTQVNQVKQIVGQIRYAKNADEILVLYQKQIKAQEGLRSINDDVAQAQATSATNLIELDGKAEIAKEKYATINSNLIEKDIAERVEAIKAIERAREADAINTISDSEALASKTLEIQVKSLEDQKAVLLSYKRDVSAIDLEIAKLKQKYADDVAKHEKEVNDKRLKNEADNANRYKVLVDAENALELQRSQFSLKNAEYEYGQNNINLQGKLALIEKIRQANIKQADSEYKILTDGKNLTTDERTKIEEAYAQKIVDINRDAQAKILTEEEKAAQAKKKILDAVVNYTNFTANATQLILSENYNQETQRRNDQLQADSDATNTKIANLQREKDSGAITQQEYDARVKKLQDAQARREKQARLEQAKADKKQALFNILINTSVAVVKAIADSPATFGLPFSAFALATGAIEAALVASRPLPTYAKGVIDLQGAGTKTSDSIHAKLSKGESVMTADETSEHKDLFKAIRSNQFDRHVNEAWVLPAIKKLERQRVYKESLRDRSMNRLGKRMKDIDLAHLERLTANNKDVRIGNVDQLADAIHRRKGHSGII